MAARGADDLFALVRSEPKRALDVVDTALEVGIDDPVERARTLRAGALASRLAGDLLRSNSYLERALEAASLSGDPTVAAEVQITMAGNQFRAGDPDRALQTLQSIEPGGDATLAARVGLQTGTIYARTNRFAEASAELSAAREAATAAGDELMAAGINKNLGLLDAYSGDYLNATTALTEARATYRRFDIANEVAYCDHNLGLVASYSGDLPRAFDLFASAEERIAELAGSEWEVQVAKVDALLSAGLATEAREVARDLATRADTEDFQIERAEALRAEAASEFLLGNYVRARSIATEASDLFAAHGRMGWRAAAELLAVRSARAANVPGDPGAIATLVAELTETGLANAELDARIEEADLLAATDADEAVARLDQLRPRLRQSRIDLRLAERTTMARARLAGGNRDGADRAARQAIDLLLEYQTVLGAGDIRVGVSLHAAEAGRIGLGLALDSGRPRRVFDWLERSKTPLLHHRGVVPEPDPDLRSALTELRAISALLDESGQAPDPDLELQRARAERRVFDRYRALHRDGPVERPVRADDVMDMSYDRTIVSYGAYDGKTFAVKLRNGRATLHHIAPTNLVERLTRTARADLRRRATGLHADADGSLTHLDDILLSPLKTTAESLVIAPTPAGFAVPWGGLPSLRDRDIAIAPNLGLWAKERAIPVVNRGAVLVGGPGIDEGATEVAAIHAVLPSATTLEGNAATAQAVLAALNGVSVAHIAAHGHISADNPLFSSLELSDGPLNVYELEFLERRPDTVVLSACHVGLPAAQPGRELLGLVGTLLGMGTRTVIASTLPLPDTPDTVAFMADLHRAMAAGRPPSAAMLDAQHASTGETQAPFYRAALTVFGVG